MSEIGATIEAYLIDGDMTTGSQDLEHLASLYKPDDDVPTGAIVIDDGDGGLIEVWFTWDRQPYLAKTPYTRVA